MKRNELVKLMMQNGWYFKRDGGNHEVWTNGSKIEFIPRHREINEMLAKSIIKKHRLK